MKVRRYVTHSRTYILRFVLVLDDPKVNESVEAKVKEFQRFLENTPNVGSNLPEIRTQSWKLKEDEA